MARGINKVILIGNLGQDPETRYMPSGSAVTNLRIATTETFKDKETGDRQERTEWHSVAMFGKLAEISAEYLKKGSQVYIEGRLRTRKWQDKEGKDRYTTEIVADEMQMLGGRGGGSGANVGGTDPGVRAATAARGRTAQAAAGPALTIPPAGAAGGGLPVGAPLGAPTFFYRPENSISSSRRGISRWEPTRPRTAVN